MSTLVNRKIQLGFAAIVVLASAIAWNTFAQSSQMLDALSTDGGGEVRRISGDRLKLKDGRDIEFAAIRLPYDNEPVAEQARKTLEKWVVNEGVRLQFDDTREYKSDRLLAYVYANDTFINVRLVREGLAFVKLRPGNQRFVHELLDAQVAAQKQRAGLWSIISFQANGEFRGDAQRATFHTPDCRKLSKSANNFEVIKGAAGAYARGWAPCGLCTPWVH